MIRITALSSKGWFTCCSDWFLTVPVSDIYVVAISSDGSQTRVEDERVFLEENRPQGVGCVALVNGSVDVPEIRVAIDDKDETPLFAYTTKTTRVRLDSGLSLFQSERRMTFVTSKPKPDFNDKTIRCAVVGSDEEHVATAVLSVKCKSLISLQYNISHFLSLVFITIYSITNS